MAVLIEPASEGLMPPDEIQVVVSARTAATRDRIAATLGESNLRTSLAAGGTVEELLEHEVDPTAIVVLACDVDVPQELASLRRLSRNLREVAIVAVSPEATGTGVRRALDAGADALIFDPELEATLVLAIRAVASGQSVVPRKLRATVERPAFSHRERQVLVYVVQGLTNAQIADRLYLSESTIKSHLASVFTKFGVRSRKEAAGLFVEMERSATAGLVP